MKRPTKEQIRALPMYSGLNLQDITIVENEQDAKQAFAALNQERCVGFDTEMKPIFNKGETGPGPTLIQLATDSHGYLFPTRFKCAVTAARKILNNEQIKKVGFGLRGDKKELRNKLDIELSNVEDLAVTLKVMIGDKDLIGARTAVAMVLNARLGKGAQKSNWGAYPLKPSQIQYAANDAHSAICIANVLAKQK
ncbi:3'-5' exonuclease domain-containing protein 2 [Psychrosphaera sp. B3R10]|uniref:3'-5' exonuclease n=1 Tax=unclassified Psychrosphaera TaxID=2641570 RepID=UPI001C0937E4|nr:MULTISPECIES: 3'-5' exonuclease [unclassified Psychrosphaera]MBU2883043.1 3'-5' exonuclease domain-containing protein 2 [Psychrosphaera sp. I2R16]MBU2988500.1 3'-5' exonuclease domain-containing protein 2 [Psychrosphaera sp. B3R10]